MYITCSTQHSIEYLPVIIHDNKSTHLILPSPPPPFQVPFKGASKASNSLESLLLNDIKSIMKHLQYAVVLASRGHHWTLLQNAARSLWNTVNTLLHACSDRLQGVKRDTITAAIYGFAIKPLYFAAKSLTDLVESLGLGDCKLSSVPTLHFSESVDDCNSVGLLFIKRIVFLAVHTLYVHQHWEKVVEVAVKFDDATQ